MAWSGSTAGVDETFAENCDAAFGGSGEGDDAGE
jgi:hypothetical protein